MPIARVADLLIASFATIVIVTMGAPGLIKPPMVREGQVILALSNPNPEITPEEVLAAGVALAADGKVVNNAPAFPGILRGAWMCEPGASPTP